MVGSCCSKLLDHCKSAVERCKSAVENKPWKPPIMYVADVDLDASMILETVNNCERGGLIYVGKDATVGQMRAISRQKFGKKKKSLVVVLQQCEISREHVFYNYLSW